ncbi:hypothetical protein M408DRAFT_269730 [Serendipita vermifera MAFF 305830]|uniref:SCN5A-like C-terminal IQ motif domain-containing protein n=1 Tax=Serendipita vermifera MAFF 305830 TaxID=933852 RepID=A0A0C3BH09_SERVB|nr:hypothetical protein M408DRAFT_269730 [Serendipita vermifera MAFF 305830]
MNVISGKGKEKETTPITNNKNNHSAPSDARDKEREEQAAVVVQRAWRHHSMKKAKLDSDARWKDVLVGTKMQVTNEAAEGNEHNDTKSRWRRGVFLAGRLRDGDAVMAADDGAGEREPSPEYTKSLATQHWLELVDPKHRYGSNCMSVSWA